MSESVPADVVNLIEGEIQKRSFRGDQYRLTMRHARAGILNFSFRDSAHLPAGDSIRLALHPQAITLLKSEANSS